MPACAAWPRALHGRVRYMAAWLPIHQPRPQARSRTLGVQAAAGLADQRERSGSDAGNDGPGPKRRPLSQPTLTPTGFAQKWRGVMNAEKASTQSHGIDLCRMLRERTPHGADPRGTRCASPKRATKTARWTLLVVLAIVLTACGTDDRPLQYLESLPEYGLAFPQAELLTSHGSPQQASIEGPNLAQTSHSYQAAAAPEDIVAWYEDELTSTGWLSEGKDGNDIYRWRREFIELQLRFGQASYDGVRYDVTLYAHLSWYDPSPLATLEAVPELSIADPSSTERNDAFPSGRWIDDRRVTPASIQRTYETSASIDEVIAFFESELASRGWTPVDPPPGDLGVGLEPDRVWQTDGLTAGLTFFPKRPSPSTIGYVFQIAEVTDALPGLPWR